MYKLCALFSLLVAFSSIVYASRPVNTNNDITVSVLPEVNGVSIKSEGSLYWLHFDADADSLWTTLENFWASEGIALKKAQPKLGFMETEWTKDMETNTLLTILLSDQAPVRRERFRLRLERLPDNKGTRVFINHSGYGILFQEEAVYTGYLSPSPELEIEMLSRLALYSGSKKDQTTPATQIAQATEATKTGQANKTTATTQAANTKPATQTVSPFVTAPLQAISINPNRYEIRMPGSLEFVRNKLIRALDRMNMNVTTETSTIFTAKVTNDATLKDVDDPSDWDIDDNSDLEEDGFSDYRNKPTGKDSKPENVAYLLNLTVTDSRVVIDISSHAGNTDDGLGLSRFSRVLARNL